MSKQGPAGRPNFDFRLAMGERDRAIRRLELMLRRSATTGEVLDADEVAGLLRVITGQMEHETHLAIDLRDVTDG